MSTEQPGAGDDTADLMDRARAAVTTRMADPDLTSVALAQALGTTVDALRGVFPGGYGVRRFIIAVRLDAALLALASWPPVVGLVADVCRAHGYTNSSPFSPHLVKRFGHGPGEVLAMRAVWPAARFRAWLELQADRYGFRADLDALPMEERRPMVMHATAPQRRGKPVTLIHTAP